MAEWFKVPVLKTEVSLIGVWVQVPFRPLKRIKNTVMGALTAKPYAFRYRPWELQAIETFDFLDAFCSPIRIDVRGLQVIRILPRSLNFNTDIWIMIEHASLWMVETSTFRYTFI